MKRYLPKKYRNQGLHVWCNVCKKPVTAHGCGHHESQRFQSRIYNPTTKRQDCIRTYRESDIETVLKLHMAFKEELKRAKHAKSPAVPIPRAPVVPRYLKECAQMYFDYMEDIGVPSYAHKKLTKQHKDDTSRYIKRFLMLVKKMEGRISDFPIAYISANHVDQWDIYINSLGLSKRSYNAHMVAVRYFIKYVIDKQKVVMENPFSEVKQKHLTYDPEILMQEEFLTLLATITEANGLSTIGTQHKTINYYRPWLPVVFKLALLIGERRDGLVLLKWRDVKGNYIGLPNWKVNRSENTDHYYSYAPITRDLADLLMCFHVGEPDDYIILPEVINRDTIKGFITKAFTHFWSKTGNPKKVTFKNLRKTYATRMRELMGEKAKNLKHTDEKTLMKHYVAEKELMAEYNVISLYNWAKNEKA